MTIIIRLQNLPLTAKSGDIRNFFGGLRIPDGGVHILGGDQGDAFIVFMSDEDARLAMRKDGGRIQNARVKLFLSSHMEMQHEVERVTKSTFGNESSPELFDEIVPFGGDFTRSRSSEKRRPRTRSRSPRKYSDHKSRHKDEYRKRFLSTASSNPRSSRYRSRSPRRSRSRSGSGSRSPIRSYSPPRSLKSRTYLQRKKSPSPRSYKHSADPIKATNYDSLHSGWEMSGSRCKSQDHLQAELEKRITEELEKNYAFKTAFSDSKHQESSSASSSNFGMRDNVSPESKDPHQQIASRRNFQDDLISEDEFKQMNKDQRSQKVNDSFYVTMTGLNPMWNFREVQIMLKGIFAPQNNIRHEKDSENHKTGTCFVKLTNKEDFENVLQKGVILFKGHQITINKCPIYIAKRFFRSNSGRRNKHYAPQDSDLCYMLKGLPFTCTYDDVVKFFSDFQLADVLIFRGEDGRATGTGFISFTNWKDFDSAKALNGQKIGHRYIELLPCTERDMFDAKAEYSGKSFVPYSKLLSEKKLPPFRRPLCAILTGLPVNTTPKKIASFFSGSGLKLDAIHVTLSKKKLSDGKAFVEFTNFIDFDLALKFHGKLLENNVVCVKQILYDEMVKILDSTNAEHHFEAPASTSSILDEPDKVPYLWDPPDEELDKFDMDHGVRDQKIPSSSDKSFGNSFSLYERQRRDCFDDDMSTEFSLKQPFPEAFHSTKKYEENIKSSRLSPENEAALLNFLNRDRKLSPKKINRRSKSPDKRGMVFEKKYYKEEKFFKSRSKENFRNTFGRNSKHGDLGYISHQRNPERSDPYESDRTNDEEKSQKCVVELTNVNTSIGLDELTSFFRGFAFDKNSLIRRFTSDGKPTLDVRVTFHDKWEAERAVKELNGFRFENKIINMHIV